MKITFKDKGKVIKNGDDGIFDNANDIKIYLEHLKLNKDVYIKKKYLKYLEKKEEDDAIYKIVIYGICFFITLPTF